MSVLTSVVSQVDRESHRLQRQWQRIPLMDRWLAGELVGALLFIVSWVLILPAVRKQKSEPMLSPAHEESEGLVHGS